ncbi:MAG TPA: hypothetical protein VIV55_08425, partial [Flavobacterium sp.]
MFLENVIKKKSFDRHRKFLFSREVNKKKTNKNMYIFAYFSEQKTEKHYKWNMEALTSLSYLIFIPSAYTLIKNFFLQGPKIFIMVIESLTMIIFINFIQLMGIAALVNKKWYAFFVISETKKYKSILQICNSFFTNCCSRLFLIQKSFKKLEEIYTPIFDNTSNCNV